MYEIEEPLTQLGLLGGGLHAGAFHPAVVHFTWPCCCEFFGGGVGGVRGASPRCDFVLILLAARPPSFARTQVRAREGGRAFRKCRPKIAPSAKETANFPPCWRGMGGGVLGGGGGVGWGSFSRQRERERERGRKIAVVHFTWPCCCGFFGGGVRGQLRYKTCRYTVV